MERIRELRAEVFGGVKRAALGFYPTPLHKLERLSAELGVELYIKRDDLSGMSLFGGNKVRKLQFILGRAQAMGCTAVFTYGATQSNHAMQTATACRRLGLKPVLYLVALVKPDEADLRANLLLDRILGAEVHIVEQLPGESEEDAEERSFAMAREHMRDLEEVGMRCCEVPMGGADAAGSAAFAEGYLELCGQLAALDKQADFLFHAAGTGGTLAGLVAGRALLKAAGLPGGETDIVSINVSEKDRDAYHRKCATLSCEALAWLGRPERVEPEDIHTDARYFAPGYEKPNPAATEAIRRLARTEGLLLDPVYTGKAFAGMLDHIARGEVPKGATVVFLHTGGTTALFAEREILGPI